MPLIDLIEVWINQATAYAGGNRPIHHVETKFRPKIRFGFVDFQSYASFASPRRGQRAGADGLLFKGPTGAMPLLRSARPLVHIAPISDL